ncbi:hypothetical protein HYS47_03725 [Candidatus Woesearchaeota archaeon]|nr:hypothetical protein [Candidatus Woesearchaeota archaeon]
MSPTISRREFLQLLAVGIPGLASGCAVGQHQRTAAWNPEQGFRVDSPEDKSSNNNDTSDPFLVKEEDPVLFRDHYLIPYRFEEYDPPVKNNDLTLEDKLFEAFFRQPYKAEELRYQVDCPHDKPAFLSHRGTRVEDPSSFQTAVLAAAQELGYSEESIHDLSIKESLLLSGRIVAGKLEYHQEMIPKNNGENTSAEQEILDIFRGKHITPDEAKRIDAMPDDKVFAEGLGICRNYAKVNVAIFNVLKSMNPNLRNTVMRTVISDGYSHLVQLPHAWNMVSTIVDNGLDIDIAVTYVDPTWLDTKIRNAIANGEADYASSQEKMYNAYDASHYGHRATGELTDFHSRGQTEQDKEHDELALVYHLMSTARLYEALADTERTKDRDSPFFASESLVSHYRRRAFALRNDACRSLLSAHVSFDNPFPGIDVDIPLENAAAMYGMISEIVFQGYFGDFQTAFVRAAENLTGMPAKDILSAKRIVVYQDGLQELKRTYEMAMRYIPAAIKQTVNIDAGDVLESRPSAVCTPLPIYGYKRERSPYRTPATLDDVFKAIEAKAVVE